MLDMHSVGLEGFSKPFAKPWFQTGIMFSAMMMCIFIHFIVMAVQKKRSLTRSGSGVALKDATKESEVHEHDLKSYCLIGVPALFDMVATTLMTYGLEFIDVSVMQMLRGSMVIFSGLLCRFALKRTIYFHQWIAIATTACACVIVGISAILNSSTSATAGPASEQIFGCLMVVLSQLVQASQIVAEDFLLSSVNAAPLQVVGMEGVWGSLVTFFIFMPLAYLIPGNDNGHSEDWFDTMEMLHNNSQIVHTAMVYWICILVLNYSGMLVTSELTAVHRTIFESVRTIAIWITDLLIYYVFSPDSVYGESWTTYSWLQLAGFFVLVFSTFFYNAMVRFPFLDSSYEVEFAEKAAKAAAESDNLV
eukprot:gnl/Ergobibamus_cyprinoides/191.p1 GENE.gnl/Ergobibamus_cyprinoides/191~~gnl/Ergobibamus_cyprinoides/191.p1  ORF type:complete len:398 (-),score=190.63 gnl/Ergobibamus_cyprinoides/191:29-1117(-)